jgi:hypothetical protein
LSLRVLSAAKASSSRLLLAGRQLRGRYLGRLEPQQLRPGGVLFLLDSQSFQLPPGGPELFDESCKLSSLSTKAGIAVQQSQVLRRPQQRKMFALSVDVDDLCRHVGQPALGNRTAVDPADAPAPGAHLSGKDQAVGLEVAVQQPADR